MKTKHFCWLVLLYIVFVSSNIVVEEVEKSAGKALSYEIECGISNENTNFNEDKIVGGKIAQPHEFPWIVSMQIMIRSKYRHICGAAVIHSQFVLTAAHCTNQMNKSDLRLAAGKNDLEKTESTEQYRFIKKIKTKSYNAKTFKNDIALIQVTEPFDVKQGAVAPICLPTGPENFYDKAIVAGWGRLQEDGDLPNELMKVRLPIVDTNYCKNIYTKEGYKKFLHNCQICTLDNNDKDSCQGDSGGPLMCQNKENNKLYVCGVVSFGIGCARENKPGVYTNVSCFTDWIAKKIKQNKY